MERLLVCVPLLERYTYVVLSFQAFDQFMTKRYGTVKRYSGEGAEAMICFVDELISSCATGKKYNNVLQSNVSMRFFVFVSFCVRWCWPLLQPNNSIFV